MNFDWFLSAVLFVFVLIGTVKAIFKPWLKNVLRLACVPVAFLFAFLLQASGVIRTISNTIVSVVNIPELLKEKNIQSVDGEILLESFAASLAGSVLFVMFFIVFLVLLRCVAVRLISKVIIKNDTENESIGFSVISGVCGALGGFLILGVVFMPLFYTADFAYSAVSVVRSAEEYRDSNVYSVLKVVDDNAVAPLEKGFAMSAYKYTGMFSLMNSTAELGGTFVCGNEKTSAKKTIDNVLENGISAIVLIQSDKGDNSILSKNISALTSDAVVLNILSDVVKSSVSDIKSDTSDTTSAGLGDGIANIICDHYSTLEKEAVAADIKALAGAVVYLNDQKLLSELIDENTRDDALSYILSNKEILSESATILSDVSSFDKTVSFLYEYEIDSLNSALGIPRDDAEAYETVMNNILAAMNEMGVGDFDPQKAEKFVVDFASSGRKITSASNSNDEQNLYKNWKRYEKSWTKLQETFSASCEDMTLGYIWYLSSDGKMYFYDSANYVWRQSDTIGTEYASSAPLCQYLAVKAVNVKYDASGNSTGKAVTREDILTYLREYPAWISSYEKCGNSTVELANKLIDKEKFVSSAVTLEKMLEKTDFASWNEQTRKEDIGPLVEIIININAISEELKKAKRSTGTEFVKSVVNQFDLLGSTLDTMAKTHCMSEIPELFAEGMLQNETFRTYLSAGIVRELNDAVKSDDETTYSSFMRSMRSMITLVIDKIDATEGK